MELTRSETVYQIVDEIRQAQNRVCQTFMEIGKRLCEVKDRGLHGDWAQHCLTFDDFLDDIGLRRTSAYNAMRVYREFGAYDTQGIPMDRLVKIAPLKIPEEEKDEWLVKARELPARGLRDEILEAKGHRAVDVCEHHRQITLHKCLDCNLTSDRPLY